MSFFKNSVSLTVSALALSAAASSASARDQVQIAGSSTVLPYASIVAEAFGENFDYPTPVVESGGSSAGLKRFCEGVGENTIDIANASRQIKPSEIEVCVANGVTEIIEVRIGYDGIRSEEHTSELQSRSDLVCRLLLEKKQSTTTTMKP